MTGASGTERDAGERAAADHDGASHDGASHAGVSHDGASHAGASQGGASQPAADPHVLEPGTLPTPFTAREIRDASPVGTVLVVRATRTGEPPTYRRRSFVFADAMGTRLEVVAVDEAGTPLEEPRVDNPSWAELQGHAVMPSASTVRDRETITTALGEHECWRYTRRASARDTQVFWFALDLPGMPIAFETRADGRVVERHEVISWVTVGE